MKVSLETFQGRLDLTQKIGDQFLLYQTLYASHLKISKLFKKAGKKRSIPSSLQIHRKQMWPCFETDKFIWLLHFGLNILASLIVHSCLFSLNHFHHWIHRFLLFRTSQAFNTMLSCRTPQGKQFIFWKLFSLYFNEISLFLRVWFTKKLKHI